MEQTQPSTSKKNYFIIGGLWLFSLLWVFGAGFLFNAVLSPTTLVSPPDRQTPLPTSPQTSVTPEYRPVDGAGIDFVQFELPSLGSGLSYFDDTLTVLIETNPPQFIAMTYSRVENVEDQFTHSTRVSYFDGAQWHRNKHVDFGGTTNFISNSVINTLQVYQDRNRVLRQRVDANLNVDGVQIQINTDVLENEIAMRTEPTYTRLFSDSTGKVTINGQQYPARLMYTKWYSMDQRQLSFYSQKYGLKTHVIDFWADDGSTIHLDSTNVQNPDELYSSHHIGIFKDKQNRVSKTFDLNVQTSNENPPTQWAVNFSSPLDITFTGEAYTFLDKAEGANYDWYRGLMNGEIKLSSGEVVKGVGAFEYINEL